MTKTLLMNLMGGNMSIYWKNLVCTHTQRHTNEIIISHYVCIYLGHNIQTASKANSITLLVKIYICVIFVKTVMCIKNFKFYMLL